MDIKVILIIILLLVVVGFGVVSFVPFGGKLLLCSSNVSNIVSESNCSNIGYISESSCPSSKADKESCQSFIDDATAGMGPHPEAYYDEKWCKSKYATLNTSNSSSFCVSASNTYSAYLDSIQTLFNSKRLIKAVQGTNAEYYYDSASTADKPSPVTLTLSAVEDSKNFKKASNKKTPDQVLGLISDSNTTKLSTIGSELKSSALEHVATMLGIIPNTKKITSSYTVDASTLTGSDVHKYAVISDAWKLIEAGNNWTYYYLNITNSVKQKMLDDLKKSGVGKYSKYCS